MIDVFPVLVLSDWRLLRHSRTVVLTGLLLLRWVFRDGGSWYFVSAVDVELPAPLGASNRARDGACD